MNEEKQNSDTNNEYDDESFDNDSSDEASGDETSIHSEESSVGELLDELLPDNSSIKSLLDSTGNSATFEPNFDDASSLNSEKAEDEQDLNSNDDAIEAEHDPSSQVLPEKNPHEIDESDSDELSNEDLNGNHVPLENEVNTEELTEIAKLLTLENEVNKEDPPINTPEIPIPKDEKKPKLPVEKNAEVIELSQRSQESEIEFLVTSQTPTSFNSDNYAFHMDVTHKPSRSSTSVQQNRNSHRKSLSFSNERMREIERHNQILLRKILTQKPRKDFANPKVPCPNIRMTTSAVNRKKLQRQIDLDNQVLKKKIEAIALRRPKLI